MSLLIVASAPFVEILFYTGFVLFNAWKWDFDNLITLYVK